MDVTPFPRGLARIVVALGGVTALVSTAFAVGALVRAPSASLCTPVYPAPEACLPGSHGGAAVVAGVVVVLAFGCVLLAARSRHAARAVPLALAVEVIAAFVAVQFAQLP